MRQCIFCGQKANSKEHVWPAWILEQLRSERKFAVAGKIDDRPLILKGFKPELKAKFVCKPCNHGWMSTLEDANRKIVAPMIHDIAFPIDTAQQWSVAQWALKNSMVMDALGNKKQAFFVQAEREQLCASVIRDNTYIWLGRYVGNNDILLAAMHLWSALPDDPKVFHCYVMTSVFGHFVIQALSGRAPYGHPRVRINEVPGPWNDILVRIWPANSRAVAWPPVKTFNDFSFGISDLINRFRPESAEAIP